MATRATDQRKKIWDFVADEMLLVCPRCSSPAWSRILDEKKSQETPVSLWADRRVTCTQCTYTKSWRGNSTFAATHTSPVKDGYFKLPLFLQVPCLGDSLWAYSPHHLNELLAWLAADLRQRKPDTTYGWSNRSYFSRLPKWMKLAKNRKAVMSAIAKLKAASAGVSP